MKTDGNVAVKIDTQKKLKAFREVRTQVEDKRKEDMFRFRTCCADPRASK